MNRRTLLSAAAAAIAAVGVWLGLCRRPAPIEQDRSDHARLRTLRNPGAGSGCKLYINTGSSDAPDWKEAAQLPPRSPGWIVTPVRPRGK